MTDAEIETLARQLVASPHWLWLPGMRVVDRDRGAAIGHVVGRSKVLIFLAWHDVAGHAVEWAAVAHVLPPVLPDLRDAATLGCLLSLVRKAWGDSTACCCCARRTGKWACMIRGDFYEATTEAGALVAALLAAPEVA